MHTRREQATLLVLAALALLALAAGLRLRATGPTEPPLPPPALDLNTATWQEFELLPGFGESLAHAVVAWRIEHGPYAAVEDLRKVPGMTDRLFRLARPEVTVGAGK